MTAVAWVLGIGIGLFLLVRFPRQVGILVVVVIAIAGAIWAYIAAQQAAAERERALVKADARVDHALCADPQYPVAITFTNGTTKTLDYIGFTLEGRMPGHSGTTVNSYLSSDVILQPGYHYQNCWRPDTYGAQGVDLTSLAWTADISSITLH